MAKGRNFLKRVRILVRLAGLVSFVSGWAPFWAQSTAGPGAPNTLRCEYMEDPLGVDTTEPRFQWVLEHSDRGEEQTAYQVLVATKPDVLAQDRGDQWDSSKVTSDESTQVVYAGKPLMSGRNYFWKIRYWDKEGRASAYSKPARFGTAL